MTTHRFRNAIAVGMIFAGLASSPTVFANEDTFTRIQREGVIHVGSEPPSTTTPRDKTAEYDADVLREVTQRLGVRMDQQTMAFDALLPSLQTHKIDLIATTLSPDIHREKKMTLIPLIAARAPAMLTTADNTQINATQDLSDKRIGIKRDSDAVVPFNRINERLKHETGHGFGKITGYQTFTEIEDALKAHQIDATILPLSTAICLIEKHPGQFKIAGLWRSESERDNHFWVAREDDQQLKAHIDQALASMARDGTLEKLQLKWFGTVIPTAQ